VQQRLPSLLDRPIAFAHRGARAHAPENTIPAFSLALRLGATGLESDVWLTAEGVPVLDHDGVVRSGRKKRPISVLPHAALPAHIPTIEQLVEVCGTGYHLSLDLKDPAAGGPVVRTLRAIAPDLVERTWLCHADHRVLVPLRDIDPRAKLVESTRLTRIKEGPERRAATLAAAGIDALNLHHSDWTGGLVALVHRFGVAAFAWDLQQDHHLRPALRMGMDAVYSDHVDLMVDAYRDELGAP
jgi:glycerophosphoryl diester phosphodiesterase